MDSSDIESLEILPEFQIERATLDGEVEMADSGGTSADYPADFHFNGTYSTTGDVACNLSGLGRCGSFRFFF